MRQRNKKLEQAIEHTGLTQRELAEKLGISQSCLNQMVNGYSRNGRPKPMPEAVAMRLSMLIGLKIYAHEIAPSEDYATYYKYTLELVRLMAQQDMEELQAKHRKENVEISHPANPG